MSPVWGNKSEQARWSSWHASRERLTSVVLSIPHVLASTHDGSLICYVRIYDGLNLTSTDVVIGRMESPLQCGVHGRADWLQLSIVS